MIYSKNCLAYNIFCYFSIYSGHIHSVLKEKVILFKLVYLSSEYNVSIL
jgi:hypothetical protein